MSYRTLGKNALATVLKSDKNISIIEKNIFDRCNEDETIYKTMIYDVLLYLSEKDVSCKEILTEIKSDKLGWKHPKFNEVRLKQLEQDDFIEHPFEIFEGIAKCGKCGSEKCFTTTKQTRSCDEPQTSFHLCLNCKHRWTYSG